MTDLHFARFSRFEALVGAEAMERLAQSCVVVVGVGGVGCGAAEGLARSGVGRLLLVDDDRVERSNMNRQLVAEEPVLGAMKAEAFAARVARINPACSVGALCARFGPDTAGAVLDAGADYVADCIDDMAAKALLCAECRARGIPLVASMGAGNRLDPTQLYVTDLFKTTDDPVARIMRRRLRALGVDALDVVASRETPARVRILNEKGGFSPGSSAFVPPAAGLVMASFIVRKLLGLA